MVYPNADIAFALKRYFIRFHFIDSNGCPSPTMYTYLDARKMNLPSTAECTADTHIIKIIPDTNDGAINYVNVQLITGYERRVLFIFDLSEFESDWVADSVVCRLYCSATTNVGPVECYTVLKSWAELEATWNSRLTGTAWGAPGLQADVDYDSTELDSQNVDTAYAWYEWDITDTFNAWVDGSLANNGLFFKTVALPCYVYFRSIQYAVTSNHPYLSITWAEI